MVYGDQAAPVNTRGSFPSGWINPGQSDPGFTLAADDAGVGGLLPGRVDRLGRGF